MQIYFKKKVDKVINNTESMIKNLVYQLQNEIKNKVQNFNFIKDYSWEDNENNETLRFTSS